MLAGAAARLAPLPGRQAATLVQLPIPAPTWRMRVSARTALRGGKFGWLIAIRAHCSCYGMSLTCCRLFAPTGMEGSMRSGRRCSARKTGVQVALDGDILMFAGGAVINVVRVVDAEVTISGPKALPFGPCTDVKGHCEVRA